MHAARPRLAWFSPMPPIRSGPAIDSAMLVPALGETFEIDVFVDAAAAPPAPGARSAHDFVWLHQQAPYDLTVYQLGNSSVHEFMWPYLFRYPGLTVLHDVHLHHARAAALLRERRPNDYRAEFGANHPDARPGVAELAVAGFDNQLYYFWPMTRLVVLRSRLTAVHASSLAGRLQAEAPGARIEAIRLGHGVLHDADGSGDRPERTALRRRYGIPADAVVFGCFGGLTPDKRLPQILAAFAAARAHHPSVRLLLAGAVPGHYDLAADLARTGIADAIVTGYLECEADLDAHIAACDVALNLRWPTAREISGPWLRSLAAGVPTVVTGLAHLADVPSLDPRTWQPSTSVYGAAGPDDDRPAAPVCVAIDILDEDHSLGLAMRRLARDAALRGTLGAAGRAWWIANHSPAAMIEDYRRIIPLAMAQPPRSVPLPPHLLDVRDGTLREVLAAFGLPDPLR